MGRIWSEGSSLHFPTQDVKDYPAAQLSLRVCLTKGGSGWVGGESNHKHVDPNNTDHLLNTAEATQTPAPNPPLTHPIGNLKFSTEMAL